jgi:hypothetical protein
MGTPGGTGDTGDTGPMGHSALVAQDATEVAVYSVNDGPDDNAGNGTIGDAPPDADPSMYFSGGVPPIEYSVTRDMTDAETPALPPMVSDTFTLEVSDSDMLVFGIKKDVEAPSMGLNNEDPNDYTMGSQFTLKATDANGVAATKMVHIMANRAPDRPETLPTFELTVGTQDAEDAERKAGMGTLTSPKCETFNVCTITPVTGDRDNDLAQFQDESADKLTFSVVSVSNGKASAMGTDDGIEVMGIEGGTAMVTVRAMDAGGLYVDTGLTVTIDGAPEVETPIASSYEIAKGASATIVTGLDSFFKDAEADDADAQADDEMTFTSKSDTEAYVMIEASDNDLRVTGVNHGGTATITVTATDSLGQTVTQTTKVKVVPAAA